MERNVLRLVSLDMKVHEVSGKETFIKSHEFFYFTPSFINNYSGGVIHPTKEVGVHGFLLVKPATFKQMFRGLSTNIEGLAFTENQIVDFIRNNRNWMNHGAVTYFLFKYRDHVVVAAIFPKHDETSFGVDVYSIENNIRWFPFLGAYVAIPIAEK